MKDDGKRVCEICAGKLPELGSFVQCRILSGYVCSSCCWNCLHHREAGSITWCSAAYTKKKDRTAMRSEESIINN